MLNDELAAEVHIRPDAGERTALARNGESPSEAPEPRPSLREGHIPGSLNLPWTDLVREARLLAATKSALPSSCWGRLVETCRHVLRNWSFGRNSRPRVRSDRRQSALYHGSWRNGVREDLPFAAA